jgi:HD-GYP domain-containing protein (c-di-GMP phosphodiesterase class II)
MSHALDDHLIALKATRLRRGMYVAALDRLWLHTPFPPGGFLVRDQKQIERIGRYCTYVYIDPHKSDEPLDMVLPFELLPPTLLAPQAERLSIDEELPWARQALNALRDSVQRMVREVRSGKLPSIEALNVGLVPMVESVKRNQDAMLWLLRTEEQDGYLYRRAMGTAVIATAYGNQLGLEHSALLELALGGLLMDIGKIEVPVTILAKTEALSEAEHKLVRKHVSHAVELVRIMENVPVSVITMVSNHHERHDGSGYPNKRSGSEIPLFARIAGIVDTFDAITQDRRYATAISAHTALRYLNGQRRIKFDGALLQEFIRAMGVYPTGTWVELLDGSIGVVCEQDPHWALTPRVAIVSKSNGMPMTAHTVHTTRLNPIIRARHKPGPGLSAPDLEVIMERG